MGEIGEMRDKNHFEWSKIFKKCHVICLQRCALKPN